MQMLEERSTLCPYCGESISLLLDLSLGDQQYIEDCPVCCRPIEVQLTERDDGSMDLTLAHENEA